MIRAFEQELHIPLRADDLWLAILIRFGMYFNSNVEKFQSMFVTHEGKMDLCADAKNWFLNFEQLAQIMATFISQSIVDDELREWIIPSFSTTTDNDRSVAAIVMIATLQQYIAFRISGGCGFPSVALLGERSDWEDILRRVERLPR